MEVLWVLCKCAKPSPIFVAIDHAAGLPICQWEAQNGRSTHIWPSWPLSRRRTFFFDLREARGRVNGSCISEMHRHAVAPLCVSFACCSRSLFFEMRRIASSTYDVNTYSVWRGTLRTTTSGKRERIPPSWPGLWRELQGSVFGCHRSLLLRLHRRSSSRRSLLTGVHVLRCPSSQCQEGARPGPSRHG